jgi:hypothetical protein
LPGASLRPGSLAFNPRPRRLSTPTDAFELHPAIRLYRTSLSAKERREEDARTLVAALPFESGIAAAIRGAPRHAPRATSTCTPYHAAITPPRHQRRIPDQSRRAARALFHPDLEASEAAAEEAARARREAVDPVKLDATRKRAPVASFGGAPRWREEKEKESNEKEEKKERREGAADESGASHTLVPIRPRRRGERRSLRTLPVVSLRPPLAFNPRLRRL